jgi:hypothetical protein
MCVKYTAGRSVEHQRYNYVMDHVQTVYKLHLPAECAVARIK